ncbi:MAG: CAP domain-containing protein [Dehalococcoidia bacterium]|nr:CAP domain-containing protein [Dehalococcoidia bacterium]
MRTPAMLLTAAATLAAAATVTTLLASPTPATAITNCDTANASLNAEELEFLRILNDERARRGLVALVPSETLNRAAAWKSEDPSAYPPLFDHVDSLGRRSLQRTRDCGYSLGAGENIAYGFGSAASVFNGWMNSPGHRANMLNKNYRAVGIGQYGRAWTLNLGTVVDVPATYPTPPTATTPTPTATATATATPTPPARPAGKKVRLPTVSRD